MQSVTRGPVCYISMSGVVDESFDPESLMSQANGTKVILNLRGISRLSSFGVREWTNAMKQLSQKVERVFLVECSPSVVSQLNMVANFAGTAQVLSVMAPYYCETCGSDAEVKIEVSGKTEIAPPETTCKCGAVMSFEDDPESYFQFPPQNSGEALTDPAVLGMMRHLGLAMSGGGDEISAPPRSETDPTAVSARTSGRPESVTMSQRPRSSSIDPTVTNVRPRSEPSMPALNMGRSGGTDPRGPAVASSSGGVGGWVNDIVNRHWQVFLGLAIVVLLVALILLLVRPQSGKVSGATPVPAPQSALAEGGKSP